MKKVRIIALISAVATGLLVFLYLSSLKHNTVAEVERVSVVVAVVNIPAGTAITEDKVTVTQLPAEAVTSGALSSTSQAVGKLAKSTIYTGEQLLSAKLITAGDTKNNTLAYTIEPGMRAITIAVNATSGLSSMIRPDDHIDILGVYLLDNSVSKGAAVSGGTAVSDSSSNSSGDTSGKTGTDKQTSKVSKTVMVLENITVLAVDSTLTLADGTTAAYSTITLQVTPKQAMLLSMAQYEGELRAILRSPLDEDITDEPGVTLEDALKK